MSVDKVRVSCRFRPLNNVERHVPFCVTFEGDRQVICKTVKTSSTALQQVATPRGASIDDIRFLGGGLVTLDAYTFSRVYQPDTTQRQLYEDVARPIVDDVMHGYNGTLLVYGQTGSGKTHTMFGVHSPTGEGSGSMIFSMHDNGAGIVPRAVRQLFHAIHSAEEAVEFEIRLQFLEIYMERVRDLLTTTEGSLHVREDPTGFYVENCETPYVTNTEEVLQLVCSGLRRRATTATAVNVTSSRSHCVLNITVKSVNSAKHEATIGKLFLVDLAGCEKVSRTLADGLRLEEAKLINKSLTTLGHVIICLAEKHSHVPYRDSKLTRILKDSLGGNSRTALILCCSPSQLAAHDTLSTLRFGARAQNVCNQAVVNRQFTMEELKGMLGLAKLEIRKLRRLLRERECGSSQRKVSTARRCSETLAGSPSQRSGESVDTSSVDILLQHAVREQLSLCDMQAELERLRDALRDAQYTTDLLYTQSAAQASLVQILQQECAAWEEEFTQLARELYAQRRYAEHYRMLFTEAREEAKLVPIKIESYMEQLRSICGKVEERSHLLRRHIGLAPVSLASLQITNGSGSPPVTPCTTPALAEGAEMVINPTSGRQSRSMDAGLPVAILSRYKYTGSGRRDNVTAAVSNTVGDVENNDWVGFYDGDKARQNMLLQRMEVVMEEVEKLRNQNGALTLELQLAEKKLAFRHGRIETLKHGLRQEGAAKEELQRALENERAIHHVQLQDARNDALYWRQHYEYLLNNSYLHSGKYNGRHNVERRSDTPTLEDALTAREHRSLVDSPVTMGHGIIVRPIRGGGHKDLT
ncbi:kinesin heavy chain [Trypanosoma rangeli SC58]|uniref:Kinesin heavy chain n=1 Tax=Trypanosoma rangeli SC58 TaxID=429131 RepID=A0A061IX68_TRYRA|nr:kinesin heavy chain [Trypanosoma rangeli SC58]